MMGNLLWRYVAKIIRKSADGHDVLISLTALHLHSMALERLSAISIRGMTVVVNHAAWCLQFTIHVSR